MIFVCATRNAFAMSFFVHEKTQELLTRHTRTHTESGEHMQLSAITRLTTRISYRIYVRRIQSNREKTVEINRKFTNDFLLNFVHSQTMLSQSFAISFVGISFENVSFRWTNSFTARWKMKQNRTTTEQETKRQMKKEREWMTMGLHSLSIFPICNQKLLMRENQN